MSTPSSLSSVPSRQEHSQQLASKHHAGSRGVRVSRTRPGRSTTDRSDQKRSSIIPNGPGVTYRIVTVTKAGQAGLREWLGIDLAALRAAAWPASVGLNWAQKPSSMTTSGHYL